MAATAKPLRLNMTSFNLIKGFSMIVIVLGHMHSTVNYEQSAVLSALFGAIHFMSVGLIPTFMLISGYSFREKPVWEQIKKSIPDLLVPYGWILLATVFVFPWVTYIQLGSWQEMIYRLKGLLLGFLFGIPKLGRTMFGIEVRWCGAAWFLLAMCISQNGLNIILKVKNRLVQILLTAVCVAMGYWLVARNRNYWCIPQGMMCVGYCYAGYLFKKTKLLEKMYTRWWVYVILAVVYVCQTVWGHFDIAFGTFNNIVLDYFGAGLSGLLVALLGIGLGKKEWRILDGIKEVGIYTYWILCIHTVEMLCFPWDNLKNVFTDHHVIVLAGEFIIRAAIIACGCIVLKKIAKSTYKRNMGKDNGKRLYQKSDN